jgi:flagellar biogenesis protein FliO
MTPQRQALNAAILAMSLVSASPSFAEDAAPIGPPAPTDLTPPAPPVAVAPVAPGRVAPPVAATPTKTGASPSWLASRPSPKPAVATGQSALPSLGRLVGLFVVLASLGGAIVYFRLRGRPRATPSKAAQRLMVVSSTRIGPKAHAVVIAVAGRQMLLGVTDSSVKRLAFIDELTEEEEERERERELSRRRDPARRAAEQARERGAGIGVRTVSPEAAKAGSFSDILKTAFGKRAAPVASDAASILASEVEDTVGGKPVAATPTNVRMLDVEGQAQGLIRRLGGGPKA